MANQLIEDTEQDLIGCALMQPELTHSLNLTHDDFRDPRLGATWEAIAEIHAAGNQPDPIRIADVAAKRQVRINPADLVNLFGRGMAVNADYYAEKIRDAAQHRRLDAALVQARQKVAEGLPVEQIIGDITSRFDTESAMIREIEKAMTLEEFIGQEVAVEDWVIPGLMTRGDRLILTGIEGLGKSVLMRQFGICVAAGRHPFTLDAIKPQRVLYLDLENPTAIMVKNMRRIAQPFIDQGVDFGERMWIKRYPQGIDLFKSEDQLMLHAMCRTFQPDLLMIGPIYKAASDGEGKAVDESARQITSVIDGLREEFGFAVVLEHHSPHGQQGMDRNVRPIGSSFWLRWPEFGYGLAHAKDRKQGVRTADFVPWRGARDQRDWPKQLVAGASIPWTAAG